MQPTAPIQQQPTMQPITPSEEKDKKTAQQLRQEKVTQVFLRYTAYGLFSPLLASGFCFVASFMAPFTLPIFLPLSVAFLGVGIVTSIFGLPIYLFGRHRENKNGRAISLHDSFETLTNYSQKDLERNRDNHWIDEKSFNVLDKIVQKYHEIYTTRDEKIKEINEEREKLLKGEKVVPEEPNAKSIASLNKKRSDVYHNANEDIKALEKIYDKYVEAKTLSTKRHIKIEKYLDIFHKNISEWIKSPTEAVAKIPDITGKPISLNDSLETIVKYDPIELEIQLTNDWIDKKCYNVLNKIIQKYKNVNTTKDENIKAMDKKVSQEFTEAIDATAKKVNIALKSQHSVEFYAQRLEKEMQESARHPFIDEADEAIKAIKTIYDKYTEAKKISEERNIKIDGYLDNFDKNIEAWVQNPKEYASKIPTIHEFYKWETEQKT